jgi:small subunit ribosomal protein S13
MARIAGVDIPREKRVVIALTYIYGVGRTRAEQTLAATDVDPDTRVRDLTDERGPAAARPHRERVPRRG